jgi:hypothetical protein
MYKNRMRPVKNYLKSKGEVIRNRNREGEFDPSILHACMEISQ